MTMSFPKLFITDLDGTALGGGHRPYSRLPDRFAEFLDRLAELGCGWATCTTWELPAQLNLIYASPVRTPPAYVIGGSGLYLTEWADGELNKVQPYTGTMEARLAESVRTDLHPLIRETAAHFNPVLTGFNGYWYSMTVQEQDAKRMLAFMEEQKVSYNGRLRIEVFPQEKRFYAHPAFLVKGTGIREILRLTGYKPEEIVVAGDERMDLSMMEPDVAAHALCPSNAHPDVKERVGRLGGFVGGSVCAEGVMEAFRRLAEARGWSGL